LSSPIRNVPFLSFGFFVFGLSWFLSFVLVVVDAGVETRREPRPERGPVTRQIHGGQDYGPSEDLGWSGH